MPKLTCMCGESINLSILPQPQGFSLVWEPVIESITDDIVAIQKGDLSSEEFEKQLYAYQRSPAMDFPHAYECFRCGRLAVFAHPSDEIPAFWFRREQQSNEATVSIVSIVKEKFNQ